MNSKINLEFKIGEVVVATQGAYSDFCINGFFVTIKEFDMKPLAAEYAAMRREANKYDEFEGFINWLIGKEYVVPVAYRELHLGAYSEFDNDFEIKRN